MKHKGKRVVMAVVIVIISAFLLTLAGMAIRSSLADRKVTPRDEEFHSDTFGENVFIFSPEDDPAKVAETIEDIYKKQEANQFGDKRYSFFFLPGEYSEKIDINVGYYTQVAGLGILPTDTSIGSMKCLARWLGNDPKNHNACCNFWRSAENLALRSNTIWAVSQATSLRRIYVDGALRLHDDYGWCSGGYLADSKISKIVDSGTQQQWLSRNCDWLKWIDQNWNMVFVGLEEGKSPQGVWPQAAYTSIDETPISREKPFVIYDEAMGYGVYVPAIRKNSKGISWEDGVNVHWCLAGEEVDPEIDCILPIDRFHIAKPGESAKEINEALEEGYNLILTPGVYELEEAIRIENEHTICLGLGLATLRNIARNAAMEVSDKSGVIVAGILFDAGTENADYLLKINSDEQSMDKQYPIFLSDIYTRIGGIPASKPSRVATSVIIDADDVVGDNFWLWRADHGDQVAWDKNVSDTGIVINGNNVVTYALMVEHFEKYQTVWNGDGGRIYMYQSEIPYDVPKQEVWNSHNGAIKGYSSIKVADDVTDFEGYGIGIYLYNRDNQVVLHSAMEMPDHKNVKVTNICTIMINGYPGMEHVINEAGGYVASRGAKEILLHYENGISK